MSFELISILLMADEFVNLTVQDSRMYSDTESDMPCYENVRPGDSFGESDLVLHQIGENVRPAACAWFRYLRLKFRSKLPHGIDLDDRDVMKLKVELEETTS